MKILIMAGGTGGHVFPALAIARAYQAQGAEVHWLGTKAGIEAEKVPAAGVPIFYLSVAGMRGKKISQLIQLPWKLMKACYQAIQVIRKVKPDVVIGMGGFASGPGGLAAWVLGKPLIIHEQNAIAGMTNRWLSHLAKKALTAFPNVLSRGICVGNPVNSAIMALPEPQERFKTHKGELRLLVLGGSLGAQAINTIIPKAIALMTDRPEIRHQTGIKHLEETKRIYEAVGVEANIVPFIEDMAEAYDWADFVICRAGALTVSELAAAGLGSILIPFPHAVDDHQTKNGEFLVEAGAAFLIQQRDLIPEILAEKLTTLDREKALQMAECARRLRQIDTTQKIIEEIKTC